MKKFITINLIMIALLFGCNPDANVISPDDSTNNKQLKLIELPKQVQGLSIETLLTRSKNINGYYGGSFAEQFDYQSTTGVVSITSQLVFPANAFSGTVTITQTFNTETASLEFGPAMVFNAAAKYTLTVSGMDLTGINPNTLDFVYVAQNGSITGVVYDSITMDVTTGTLKVTNARLNHFSRYGFVN
ncbi:MAG TPA: hypothetical protein PLH53_02635 [Ignavibacteriaceae bacterium]|nr:hypothetical protein [Ignavibacteriaceae bacterium]HRP91763.1 hypothetical protein [Ignavibacteriaceae bacterium]